MRAWLSPRQIGRREYTPSQRAYRRPQHKVGEKCGLVIYVLLQPVLQQGTMPELASIQARKMLFRLGQ